MRKIVFALSVLALVWINRYFWFLPRNQKVDLEPYSVAVQAIDEKTGDRLDGAEFICYEYDDEGNYAKSEYKEGICYFYDLEPETNYIVGQTYFVGSYIPEVREYTVYVNSDGSIEYLTGSYVDRSGILTFKNYLAGKLNFDPDVHCNHHGHGDHCKEGKHHC